MENVVYFDFGCPVSREQGSKISFAYIGYGHALTASDIIKLAPCMRSTKVARGIYEQVLVEKQIKN